METNEVDYSCLAVADYYNLRDEDTGAPLNAAKVLEGVQREMQFMKDQNMGTPTLIRDLPAGCT
eukprot:4806031-Amphidinium_carterae.1